MGRTHVQKPLVISLPTRVACFSIFSLLFCARITRDGQTRKVEILCVCVCGIGVLFIVSLYLFCHPAFTSTVASSRCLEFESHVQNCSQNLQTLENALYGFVLLVEEGLHLRTLSRGVKYVLEGTWGGWTYPSPLEWDSPRTCVADRLYTAFRNT